MTILKVDNNQYTCFFLHLYTNRPTSIPFTPLLEGIHLSSFIDLKTEKKNVVYVNLSRVYLLPNKRDQTRDIDPVWSWRFKGYVLSVIRCFPWFDVLLLDFDSNPTPSMSLEQTLNYVEPSFERSLTDSEICYLTYHKEF